MSIYSLVGRIRATLAAQGISASLGFASRHPTASLAETLHQADSAMYAEKRRK